MQRVKQTLFWGYQTTLFLDRISDPLVTLDSLLHKACALDSASGWTRVLWMSTGKVHYSCAPTSSFPPLKCSVRFQNSLCWESYSASSPFYRRSLKSLPRAAGSEHLSFIVLLNVVGICIMTWPRGSFPFQLYSL